MPNLAATFFLHFPVPLSHPMRTMFENCMWSNRYLNHHRHMEALNPTSTSDAHCPKCQHCQGLSPLSRAPLRSKSTDPTCIVLLARMTPSSTVVLCRNIPSPRHTPAILCKLVSTCLGGAYCLHLDCAKIITAPMCGTPFAPKYPKNTLQVPK